ncbi:MAG: hypothetical protein IJR70_02660 [Eubacterium sp.]|nr:hypothetical protein [Eubacterium sp.]
MVEIKKIFKSSKALICFVAFLLVLIVISFDFFSSSEVLSPSPSHIVLTKWIGKNKRKTDIVFTDIEKQTLVQTKLKRIPFSQTKFIIKTNNLRFSLFTDGKIIFKNTDKKFSGYGKHIHIIDISDLKKNAQLYLLLSPVKNEKGRIENSIYLSSNNDFLLDLILKNQKAIFLFILIFIMVISSFIIGIIKLIKRDKSAPKMLYFSLFTAIIGIIVFSQNDISQFVFSNDITRYILQKSLYSLLGVFVSAFLCSVLKIRSKITIFLNALIIFYAVLRVILFFAFLIPFSDLSFISHILMILSIIFPIILKLCRYTRQSFILLSV